MAGAGFKTFNTGDVLTASDVNTYLMQQTVMVFASSAARTTALGANVAEGMLSYLKDTDVVEVYNGSAWVSSDDPNAIQNTIVDAKGDLISATAADTPARLAVGTDGQVLTADSSTATGLKWATAGASGKVLQVVQGTTSTSTAIASTTFTDTTLTASITPSATTSKILVLISQFAYTYDTDGKSGGGLKLLRGATEIFTNNNAESFFTMNVGNASATAESLSYCAIHYLDSPSRTSSLTYKTQGRREGGTGTIIFQNNSVPSSIILLEIGA